MKLRVLLGTVLCMCTAAGILVGGAQGKAHRVIARRAARAAHRSVVRPAHTVLTTAPPTVLAPMHFTNTTAASVSVRVWPVLLRQRLDGSFAYSETPGDLALAARMMSVTAPIFILSPGQTHTVGLTWRHVAPGTRSAYIGFISQGLPTFSPGGVINTTAHLLRVRLLELPGGRATGRFTQVATAKGPGTSLHFIPRVVNTGDRVGVPSNATLTILDARHKVILRKVWHGDVVLPGASRDFIVPVRMQLPAGGYTAVSAMSFGAAGRTLRSTRFTLVAPNTLATRGVVLRDLAVRAQYRHPAQLRATLASTGNASSGTTVTVSLYRLADGNNVGETLATRVRRFHGIAPGSSRQIALTLGGPLPQGRFLVSVSYHDRPGSHATVTSEVAAAKPVPFLHRVWHFARGNIALSVMIAVILLLLAATAVRILLIRWHRWRARRANAALTARQQSLAAELAATAASRARQRRLAAEFARSVASPREQELAEELAATTISVRRQRRRAAELAVGCLAATKAAKADTRLRQPV